MKLVLVLLLSFFSSFCSAKWYAKQFEVMGTQAKVEFESQSEQQAAVLITRVIAEMVRIDELMSPFKPTSELSLINDTAYKNPVIISTEMVGLLQRSIYYSELTNGAFDITFSSLGYLYDFRNKVKPNAKQRSSLTPEINYRSILLDRKNLSVSFANPHTKIDLGGIAKGHAVDQCIDLLRSAGVTNAFVSAGGDSRVIGKKNDRLWYIGIRHPRDERKLLVNLPLEEVAISTSGDYERFFQQDGIRYHHIIDPSTGDSARQSQSVTILAERSLDADALSTSIFVLGPKKGLDLINTLPQVSAIIVDSNGKMSYSNDLAAPN
jgi:FAD:protein FMN transferase